MKHDTLRAIVLAEIPNITDLTKIKVVEIIKGYVDCDKELLYQQYLGRKADRIIGSIKDDNGIRKYFLDGTGRYIDVETSENIVDLTNVERQLFCKLKGVGKSYKKVRDRRTVLDGQISFLDEIPETPECGKDDRAV